MVNVDKLKDLPQREGKSRYLIRMHGSLYDLRRWDNPWHRSTKSDYAWVKVKRVIKKFMGKSFADAFSYYCKLVDQHEQKEFLDVFKNKRRSWYEPDYIINGDGNIALNPNRYIKKSRHNLTLRSFDYEEGYCHIITGEIITYKEYIRLDYHTNFINVVIHGFERTFESKKDIEYIRMRAEITIQKKLNVKAWKQYNRYKPLCFLTYNELQEKIKHTDEKRKSN